MSPNNKEEEYVDLYSDLFNDDEVHHSAKCATSTTTNNNNNNNNNNNKSSLDDEVLFFGHLGSLETEVKELRAVRQTLTTENEQLKATLATKERTIAVLRNNISSLYKTAKLELERRSAELAEVRREYDTLIFRRRTSQAAAGAGAAGEHMVQVPVPPPPPPVESPVIMIGTEQSTARSADRHSSHNSPLGSSSFSRYSPYSTPRHSENASSNRKEAVRPATEPIHRTQSRYSSSSSSSSRHSSSTPIRHHHSHQHHSHHHHHQHRNRLFD